ncbi:MAG: DUF975 family protein [Lachnospiraceae bacterium]
MWTREQLKSNAKINFKRNYWPCVGVGFIVMLISSGGATSGVRNGVDYVQQSDGTVSSGISFFDMHSGIVMALAAVGVMFGILGILFTIFVGNVLRIGADRFFIQNRSDVPGVGTVLDGFRSGHYGNIVVIMLLKDIFTTLWTMLFVVPGIIKGLEYLMIPYILAENPGMDRKEAFMISKRMMDGEKWNAFVLELSFIGWYLVSAITCGLAGIFYVTPYVEATMTELYAYNKGKAYQEGYIR